MSQQATLKTIVNEHKYPLVFATISGSHLYGFPSPDSDFDLRGVHVLPLENVISLNPCDETIDVSKIYNGMEIDFVTHDLKKFIGLMLKRNGYVLEQLLSPLVVLSSPEHEQLKQLASGRITRHHANHYLGFSATQWHLVQKESRPRVKPMLYTFQVLLTGIHLMRTGEIEANISVLNENAKLPYLPDLIQQKTSGEENSEIESYDSGFFQAEYDRLRGELEEAYRVSSLPDMPTSKDGLNDLLIRIRRTI